jgi:hypothetical protein
MVQFTLLYASAAKVGQLKSDCRLPALPPHKHVSHISIEFPNPMDNYSIVGFRASLVIPGLVLRTLT